jgi:hypothetical protein
LALGSGASIWVTYVVGTPPDISYAAKQIDLLQSTASALIPTVAGFAVLAASATGYLYKHRLTDSVLIQSGIMMVFTATVVSLACWIYALGGLVDASAGFGFFTDGSVGAGSPDMARRGWRRAIVFTEFASFAFFMAVDLAMWIALQVFTSAERPRETV